MSRVPRIRFKGFEEDWEQRKLGEVAIFNPKSKLPSTFEYVDLESVIGTEMVSHSTKTISTAPSRAQRLAKKGDIFYQTVRPYQKNNYLFEKDRRNYVFSTGYAQLRPSVNERFLFYLIQNGNFVNMVLYNCTGTSYPAINSSDLRRIDIYLSRNSTEQKCIGNTIKTLDHLITLHQSKSFGHILEEIVSCALSWEQRKLGDICQITMGQSPDGSTYSETPSDYILVQGNADLKDGWVYPRIWTTQKTKMAYVGDLIMSVRAPAGTMGKTYYDVVIGRGVAGIKGSEFIYQALVKMDSGGYWKILAAGSTFESINSDVVNGAELMVTENVDEQNRIGDCFASIDHLITLHQLEPFQLIFKAIAYRIIDYAKSKPPRHTKYKIIISFIKYYL